MKLVTWCFVVLSSFFLGILVMLAFYVPNETYKEELNIVRTTDLSTPSESEKKCEQFNVSLKEALKTYQAHYPSKVITSIEVDKKFGPYYYKISGKDEKKEYNLEISTKTTNVKKKQIGNLKKNKQAIIERSEESNNIKNLKDLSEITKIVEKYINKGQVAKWSLEKNEDRTYWVVMVKEMGRERNVNVDAYTGTILVDSVKQLANQ